MPDTPLTDLTADDLLLNLWLSMILTIEQFGIDPDDYITSVCRVEDAEPAPDHGATTLTALLAEIERRLGIDSVEIDSSLERLQ